MSGCQSRGVIPAALDVDRCPIPCSDGADAVRVVNEEVPGGGEGLDDGLVTVPDPGAELVAAEVIPDVLHWVQLRRVGRQGQQNDVVWHCEFTACLVPPGTVADQSGDRARCNLCADLLKVQVHAFG